MNNQELKLHLIQWILEIKSQETLEFLLLWKDKQRREREARFFSLCGSWQSEQTGDQLAQEIYESRMDYPREVEL
ncbi:MAG: hypothetical protein NW226_20085 [Microscillaceae bacterium]|nr:hypothetical protein [Microscillaceae bacterium]